MWGVWRGKWRGSGEGCRRINKRGGTRRGLQQCCKSVMGEQSGYRGTVILARGAEYGGAVGGAAYIGGLVVEDVCEALRAGELGADLLFVGEFKTARTKTFPMALVACCLGHCSERGDSTFK